MPFKKYQPLRGGKTQRTTGSLLPRLLDLLHTFNQRVENSNRIGVRGLRVWQYDLMRAVIQVVNVDDLRMRILNVGYGEAERLLRLRRSDEAGNRHGKCELHLRLIGGRALFR